MLEDQKMKVLARILIIVSQAKPFCLPSLGIKLNQDLMLS